MSNTFEQSGYQASILTSNEDYEPYGYDSARIQSTVDGNRASAYARSHERMIEVALFQKSAI